MKVRDVLCVPETYRAHPDCFPRTRPRGQRGRRAPGQEELAWAARRVAELEATGIAAELRICRGSPVVVYKEVS